KKYRTKDRKASLINPSLSTMEHHQHILSTMSTVEHHKKQENYLEFNELKKHFVIFITTKNFSCNKYLFLWNKM
ncbi:TPA: hypothetical protein ACX6DV_003504, partial [Vibrio cholerae]